MCPNVKSNTPNSFDAHLTEAAWQISDDPDDLGDGLDIIFDGRPDEYIHIWDEANRKSHRVDD